MSQTQKLLFFAVILSLVGCDQGGDSTKRPGSESVEATDHDTMTDTALTEKRRQRNRRARYTPPAGEPNLQPPAPLGPTQQPNQQPAISSGSISPLKVQGNKIVDMQGRVVTLRGVNLEDREWYWPGGRRELVWEPKAIPVAARDWGANIFVIAFASGPVNRNDAAYFKQIDDIIAMAKTHDAYTLLAYRYGEPNSEQAKMPDEAAQMAIAKLAARYRNEPAALYALQVEPHEVTWAQLKPRFTSMVDAIRANHPEALIFVPGTEWSHYVHYALTDPVPRENLAYKVHVYMRFADMKNRLRLAEVSAKFPVFIGEFGPANGPTVQDCEMSVDYFEQLQIGWAGWLFHTKATPMLMNEQFQPTPWGSLIRSKLKR